MTKEELRNLVRNQDIAALTTWLVSDNYDELKRAEPTLNFTQLDHLRSKALKYKEDLRFAYLILSALLSIGFGLADGFLTGGIFGGIVTGLAAIGTAAGIASLPVLDRIPNRIVASHIGRKRIINVVDQTIAPRQVANSSAISIDFTPQPYTAPMIFRPIFYLGGVLSRMAANMSEAFKSSNSPRQ